MAASDTAIPHAALADTALPHGGQVAAAIAPEPLSAAVPRPAASGAAAVLAGTAALTDNAALAAALGPQLAPGATSGAAETRTPLAPALTALAQVATREDGTARVVLRLDPPELGSVLVTLTTRGGDVHVSLVAGDVAAASALEARRPEVRGALAEAGLDLSGWSVGTGLPGEDRRSGEHPERSRALPHPVGASGYAENTPSPSPTRVTAGLFL